MRGLEHLPREALQRLTRELAGEKVLWAGQPDPRTSFWRGSFIWLFAIPWTAFSIGWETIALGMFFSEGAQAPAGPGGIMAWIFPIFGLPFVVIGLGMMGSPFWAAWKALRQVHVLTDQRLVSARLGRNFEIETIDPGRIVSIKRHEKRGGIGSLSISLGKFRDSDGDAVEKTVDWVAVPDVKMLEDRLREVMKARAAN